VKDKWAESPTNPAAKRRKSAAHGASRGLDEMQKGKSPRKGRKKLSQEPTR